MKEIAVAYHYSMPIAGVGVSQALFSDTKIQARREYVLKDPSDYQRDNKRYNRKRRHAR